MKQAFYILLLIAGSSFIGKAQYKGTFKWLGSNAQNGGTGGVISIDTPANTYTLYGRNTAYTGYDPVCTQCPAFDAQNELNWVYRTYDNQHNLIKKRCVKLPNVFVNGWSVAYHEKVPDGNFIYGGMGPNYYAVLCKADSFGSIIWKDSFYLGGGNSVGFVEKLSNSHYILYGTVHHIGGLVDTHYGHWTIPDAFLMEVDTLGTVYWSKVIGGTGRDDRLLVKERSDGIYLMANTSSSYFNAQLCKGQNQQGNIVVKINSAGQTGCSYRFHGALKVNGAIVEPNDDLVMFACGPTLNGTNPMNPHKRFQISKIDSNGNQIWWKEYGFDSVTSNTSTYQFGMIKNPLDDGYILWGSINNDQNGPLGDVASPTQGDDDIWLIFLDHNGDLLGQLSYGGNYYDVASQVIYYPYNNSFLLQGGTKSGTGDFVGGHFFPSQLADGEAFLSEIIYWPSAIDNTRDKLLTPLVQVYPNPSTRFITLSFAQEFFLEDKVVKLTDLNGRLIKKFQLSRDAEKVNLDLGELASSTYTLSVYSRNGLQHSEQVIMRQ